jgi:hypothetical protein
VCDSGSNGITFPCMINYNNNYKNVNIIKFSVRLIYGKINCVMDKFVVKNTIIYSLILGLILGLLAPIPYIGMVTLMTMLLLVAPLVMVYMIMAGQFALTSTKNSIITGAISGFSANFSFSFTYAIMMVILSKLFHITTNFFLTAMIVNSPIWLILVFVIFVGVLFATTNAFSGFLTHYVIDFIRDIYDKKNKGT